MKQLGEIGYLKWNDLVEKCCKLFSSRTRYSVIQQFFWVMKKLPSSWNWFWKMVAIPDKLKNSDEMIMNFSWYQFLYKRKLMIGNEKIIRHCLICYEFGLLIRILFYIFSDFELLFHSYFVDDCKFYYDE